MRSIILVGLCLAFPKLGTGLKEESLQFPQLAARNGHVVEEYDVITEDGYILRLFRIAGKSKQPVLLVHGIMDSADTWVLRGNGSLASALISRGYDVWFANCRGNRYARRHIFLDPEASDGFWNYSFHEHGYYDMPAIIDTVLHLSGAEKLDAIGHSQGTTSFFVLTSTRPEYNQKVNLLIGLAPVCFLGNVEPPLKTLIQYSPVIYNMATSFQWQEVFGKVGINHVFKSLCMTPIVGYSMCIMNTIFPLTGYDEDELEVGLVPLLLDRFPAATTVKNLYHFGQVSYRREFAQFDHGADVNVEKYRKPTPPVYDLNLVTIKVALLVGENDKVSTVEDVALLKNRLPNVVQHMIIPYRKMNHANFIWGRHMDEYLFPYIFETLQKHQYQEYPEDPEENNKTTNKGSPTMALKAK